LSSIIFDAVLNQPVVELAEDRGGTVLTRGAFTGDDKDRLVEAADVAAPNTLGANDAIGAVIIGGRDTGGNFRFDFADGTDAASKFLAEVTDLLGDFRTILADDPNDASDQKAVLEQLLKRVARPSTARSWPMPTSPAMTSATP
jgi:hypothetical protein